MIVGARARSRAVMRAAHHAEWGADLKVGTLPRPEPAAGEVRVAVRATSVNPIDMTTAHHAGYEQSMRLPFVPGWDVAGVIDAVGYGVTRHAVGDRVFGLASFPHPGGSYAEYVVAPAFHLVGIPEHVGDADAGAVPMAALTAWQMLDAADVSAGSRVLVTGASGGVGHLAVQLAAARGAFVIALARSEQHAVLANLGADRCVDYRDADALAAIERVDALVDLVGHRFGRGLFDRVRRGGSIALATAWSIPSFVDDAAAMGISAHSCLVEPDPTVLRVIGDLLARGMIRPMVGARFSLDEAAEAQAWVTRRRGLGKSVITIDPATPVAS